jgi:glycosyltransferase involved in cell wall biosynthesis
VIVLQAVADGRLGGGTTHVLQLIEALAADLPCELHLVSDTGSPALVEAARLGAVCHGIDFFTMRLDPRISLRLGMLIRRLRPALVHAHGARAGLPLAGLTRRAPLFYSVHGYHFVGKRGAARRLAIAAERWCSARAARTLFVCQHDRRLAEEAGILGCRSRCEVVPNGIDLAGLPAARGAPGGRTFGFLGRLEEVKNPLLLLDLLAALEGEDHRLVVIGDGPLMAVMRSRAAALGLADRGDLAGSLARAQALERLAGLDVLVVPSLWEGMPLAPLEAMAIGVPVVASRVGGLPEIIVDGQTGLLIDGHDPASYARAVRRLTDGSALRGQIVERARADVARRFSWAVARQTYLELYREALALR